jgi:HAAS domain-containing protein
MSTTTGLPPNVADYLDALRAELADLAPEERDDLLSEVEPSLLEAAADGDEPIASRLGPAADFAADLRASAGLPPARRSAPPRTGVTAALRELARRPAVLRALGVLRELAPIWWVARAYVAVEMLAIATGQGAQTVAETSRYPEVPRLEGPYLGLFVLALAVVASIAAGLAARRRPGRGRAAMIAVNVVLALLAIPVADQIRDAAAMGSATAALTSGAASSSAAGLSYDGVAVDNVYPYDRAGRLLHDVRLYDERGTALEFGRDFANPDRRTVRDAQGATVFNAYPIRYFEPGTSRVAEPDAGPSVQASPLATPPLGVTNRPAKKQRRSSP